MKGSLHRERSSKTSSHRHSGKDDGSQDGVQYRRAVLRGRSAASIFHMQLIKNDVDDWKAKSEVIAVFHTNAGHVTLHDTAYNTDRNIATGNPYKHLVADLAKRGVQIELCGATAKVHGWGNADLLPGIKVNTDAMARTTQLVQEGFVKISE
jgi:intracellular sulfur oxidation DsrE/DsrF family protein